MLPHDDQHPAFAEASALYPDDKGEWQAAIYLLTRARACHLYKRFCPTWVTGEPGRSGRCDQEVTP